MGKIRWISVFIVFSFSFIKAQSPEIFLTEVMFYPQVSNSEFIEIFNSSADSVYNLSGAEIIYETSSADNIIPAATDSLLLPGKYAVILEGDYDFENGPYKLLIPDDVLILKIDNNSFGSTGMANTSDRRIKMVTQSGDTIFSYLYSGNNQSGFSDEKINISNNDSSENWANSKVLNGTPGFKNSVTPNNYDFQLKSAYTVPSNLIRQEKFDLYIKAINIGKLTLISSSLTVYLDENRDSIFDPSEIFLEDEMQSVLPADSAELVFRDLQFDDAGIYNFLIKCRNGNDEDTLNNELFFSLIIKNKPANANDLVINEIMYLPLNDEPEWIELYNRSENPVDLRKWKISDASSSVNLKDSSIVINPGEFLVISSDPQIANFYTIQGKILTAKLPSLNNSGDKIAISDSTGKIIDSLTYKGVSADAGKSLERIDTENFLYEGNWLPCRSKTRATPGEKNSVTRKEFDAGIVSVKTVPQNPSAGDETSVVVKIKNYGRNKINNYISLWTDTENDSIPDEQIETSSPISLNAGDSIEVTFSRKILLTESTKYFIIKLASAGDEFVDNNEAYLKIVAGTKTNSIVINEIMYLPLNDEPEWIELYNRSENPVDLRKWKISDASSSVNLKDSSIVINPGEFLVISSDPQIANFYTIQGKILTAKLPSLNNSGDEIAISDSTGKIIDSLTYKGVSADAGKSLERIDTENFLYEGNWMPCRSKTRATPGEKNSVTKKDFDLSVKSFNIFPKYPAAGQSISFSAEIINSGKNEIKASCSLFSDADLDSVADKQISVSEEITIMPDSVHKFNFNNVYQLTNRTENFILKINCGKDEFTDDNEAFLNIIPSMEFNSVIITEIMFNPDSGKSEWIEIFNNSEFKIDLKNWQICDNRSQVQIGKSDSVIINPEEYMIIASDTSFITQYNLPDTKMYLCRFPSLNNDSDEVILKENNGKTVDSVYYLQEPLRGFSIEKIDFSLSSEESNWIYSISPDGSTPGRENTLGKIPEYEKGSLAINEILFDTDAGKAEFIELLNFSEDSVDLATVKIIINDNKSFRTSNTSFILKKGEYFVAATDTSIKELCKPEGKLGISFFSLPNTGGSISVKDLKGNLIDSVSYYPSLHNPLVSSTKNCSLEKINPGISGNDENNWTSCVSPEKSTPGRINSVFISNYTGKEGISISPNPFSPDNDGFEDFTIINYNLKPAISFVRVRLFDTKGRVVRTIADGLPVSSSGSIIYDGYDSGKTPLRVGIYILLFEAFDNEKNSISVFKEALVIARKF